MKSIFLTLLFTLKIFACSMCQIDVPMVHINVISQVKDSHSTFDIQWEFSQEFTKNTLLPYDINQNGIYDKAELNLIKQSLEEYLEKDSYLSFFKLVPKDKTVQEIKPIKTTISDQTIIYKDEKIYYYYTIKADIQYQPNHKLFVEFFDKGEFFKFVLQNFEFKHPDLNSQQQNNYDISFYFYDPKEEIKQLSQPTQLPPKVIEQVDSSKETMQTKKTLLQYLSQLLEQTKNSMQELLTQIRDNNSPSAYFWLLLFSFVYGVIHAIGPGHGKSLVSAYFLNDNRSAVKAFNISMLIGTVHTFSALILTLIIYFIVQSFFSTMFDNVEKITTQISALIIMAIALYLLYTKLKKKKTTLNSFTPAPNASFVKTPQEPISHVHTHSCGCNACKTTSTDLMVVLAAGIVPCPGTVTIFIFTLSMGVLFVGFLSAVFMSLGMSLIIFITAYLSIKIRSTAVVNSKLKMILEYGSLLFIFTLGLLLLLL